MATVELTEFFMPPIVFGQALPVRPMPGPSVTVDTTVNSGIYQISSDDCVFIAVIASADMRMSHNGAGGNPADPTATITLGKQLKSGIEREFALIAKGTKTKVRFG